MSTHKTDWKTPADPPRERAHGSTLPRRKKRMKSTGPISAAARADGLSLTRSQDPEARGKRINTTNTKRRRNELRPVSAKRARENTERRAVLLDMTAGVPVACQRCDEAEATDPHEVVPRSAGGSITDPENIRLICRRCHRWIHDHPTQARAVGWLAQSGGEA